jgi:DNA modification methylase
VDIIKKKIKDLKPADYNPRKINDDDFEQLKKSLEKFEAVEPAIINSFEGRENIIVGGHQRIKAAKSLGWKEFPCVMVNLDLDQEKELNVRLNKNTGEFDFDILKEEFQKDDLLEFGFSDDELFIFDEVEITEGLTDEDSVPEIPEEPKTKEGDIYILGNHRLMCGDSTSIDAVEKLMDGEKADLIVTDPPYNVAYEGKTKDALTIQNDSMDDDSFYNFLYDVHVNYFSIAKEGAGIYVFHADLEGLNFRKAFKESGFDLKQCLIWVKQTMVMGRQDYHWKHEPCLYGWKPGAAHNWYSDRKQTTVWNFDRPMRNDIHPTMKPIDLIEYPITNSSKNGDIVVDFFGGSGSCMIACEKTGRKARLMELDPKYCDVIVKRWEDFTGKKAELLNG